MPRRRKTLKHRAPNPGANDVSSTGKNTAGVKILVPGYRLDNVKPGDAPIVVARPEKKPG
jgi:hypothetical protein